MKTNNSNLNFFSNSFNTLLLAVALGMLVVVAAKAESNFNFDVLNGLFTPTQSERFFQAGREDFEREIDIFNHPELYPSEDLLQIDPELVGQMNRLGHSVDFKLENGEYELHRDR